MHECGIERILPDGLRTPVLHYVKHVDAHHLALWWEFVAERAGPWQLADYERAAHLLGRLAARRQEGAAINRLLPAACRQSAVGSALRRFVEGRVLMGFLPALRDEQTWRHPLLAEALRQADDPTLPEDLLALAGRLRGILDMLERLPQTYAHGDGSPQNLLRPASDPGGLVVIDWGFGSPQAIGFDLGQLLVGLAQAGSFDPSELRQIDAAILPAYLSGLRAEHYDFDAEVVRTGYVGSLIARSALCALPLELLQAEPSTENEAVLLQRVRLTRVLLQMAAVL
jgi:hypothetical protein